MLHMRYARTTASYKQLRIRIQKVHQGLGHVWLKINPNLRWSSFKTSDYYERRRHCTKELLVKWRLLSTWILTALHGNQLYDNLTKVCIRWRREPAIKVLYMSRILTVGDVHQSNANSKSAPLVAWLAAPSTFFFKRKINSHLKMWREDLPPQRRLLIFKRRPCKESPITIYDEGKQKPHMKETNPTKGWPLVCTSGSQIIRLLCFRTNFTRAIYKIKRWTFSHMKQSQGSRREYTWLFAPTSRMTQSRLA